MSATRDQLLSRLADCSKKIPKEENWYTGRKRFRMVVSYLCRGGALLAFVAGTTARSCKFWDRAG
jgi:hypothetical protein